MIIVIILNLMFGINDISWGIYKAILLSYSSQYLYEYCSTKMSFEFQPLSLETRREKGIAYI